MLNANWGGDLIENVLIETDIARSVFWSSRRGDRVSASDCM